MQLPNSSNHIRQQQIWPIVYKQLEKTGKKRPRYALKIPFLQETGTYILPSVLTKITELITILALVIPGVVCFFSVVLNF